MDEVCVIDEAGQPRDEGEGTGGGDELPPVPVLTDEYVAEHNLLTTAAVATKYERSARAILTWTKRGLRPAGSLMVNKTSTFVFREEDVSAFVRDKGYEGRWVRQKPLLASSVAAGVTGGVMAGRAGGPVVVDDAMAAAARLARVPAGQTDSSDEEGEDITADTLLGSGGVDMYALLEALVRQLVPVLNKKLDDKTTSHDLKQHSGSITSLLEQIKRLQAQVEKQAERNGDIVPLAVAQEMVVKFCQATVSQCERTQRELSLAIMEVIQPRLDASQDSTVVRREISVCVQGAMHAMRQEVVAAVAGGNVSGPVSGEQPEEKHAA